MVATARGFAVSSLDDAFGIQESENIDTYEIKESRVCGSSYLVELEIYIIVLEYLHGAWWKYLHGCP